MLDNKIDAALNLGYYKKYYQSDSPTKLFLSFNVWAFLFGVGWFCYRRMMGVGIALYVLSLVISFALHCSPLVPAYIKKEHLLIVDVCINLSVAFFANWIYMRHIAKWSPKKELKDLAGFKYFFIGFLIMLFGLWAPYAYLMYKTIPYKQRQLLSIIEEDSSLSIALYKHLLKKDYKLEEKNDSGETVTFIAAKKNHIQQLKYFSGIGANLEAKNKNGIRPIDIAAFQGHVRIVEFLIDKGVDFHSESSQLTPLMAASYAGHLEMVKLLIAHDVNVNYITKLNGYTALNLALAQGNTEIADYLMKYGAKNGGEKAAIPLRVS